METDLKHIMYILKIQLHIAVSVISNTGYSSSPSDESIAISDVEPLHCACNDVG